MGGVGNFTSESWESSGSLLIPAWEPVMLENISRPAPMTELSVNAFSSDFDSIGGVTPFQQNPGSLLGVSRFRAQNHSCW